MNHFNNALTVFNKVINKLSETYNQRFINDMFEIGESGIYLLLCGYINDNHNIYKPGISNTNIYNYITGTVSQNSKEFKQKEFILDYFDILKNTFNTNYIKISNKKIKQSVYKQLQARNGTINKNTCKTFTTYESKENFLPVIFRYQTSILKAIFIENYLSYAYKSIKGLKFNLGRLFYNGYCYKAYLASKGLRTSGNETESKILNKTFEEEFKNICISFNCETVEINIKQNDLKYKCLNDYYKQFDNLDETNLINFKCVKDYLIQYRTNDIFKYRSNKSKKTYKQKLNYKHKKELDEETLNRLINLVKEWKNSKTKLSDIIDIYFDEIILALELYLIQYENSKIKYLNF